MYNPLSINNEQSGNQEKKIEHAYDAKLRLCIASTHRSNDGGK